MKQIKISNKLIGDNEPCFIIAEVGANFRISDDMEVNYKQAIKLIDIAAEAKADAVKFQLYRAEKLYVKDAGCADYLNKKEPIFDIIKEMELPYEWLHKLKEYCDSKGIIFLCSPFDEGSADELEKIGVSAYKIASYSITHTPLLRYIAKKGKPIILSTGASDLEDIRKAIKVIKSEGNEQIILMQCTAKYPAPLSTMNLRTIHTMIKEFNILVGLSDHSRVPYTAPLGAIALGAKIIEKHFTINNSLPGPDHGFAILADELKELVKKIRKLESTIMEQYGISALKKVEELLSINEVEELKKAIGTGDKIVQKEEEELYKFARRYIYAKKEIKKGEVLNKENIAVLRGGKEKRGLEPEHFEKILGKRATKSIKAGEPINKDKIEVE